MRAAEPRVRETPRRRRWRTIAVTAALVAGVFAAGTLVWAFAIRPDPLVLVRDGRSQAAIAWWSRDDSRTPFFAASELADHFHAMSGVDVPVVEAEMAESSLVASLDSALLLVTKQDEEGFQLFERSSISRSMSVPASWFSEVAELVAGMRSDGFAIEPRSGGLVMAGSNHRGTLYAAYEVLERLGVRFFAPRFDFYEGYAEGMPRMRTLAVDPFTLREEASFEYRRKHVEEGWSHTPRNLVQLIDWMGKARLNVLSYPYNYLGKGFAKWDSWRRHLIPELEKRGILLEVGGHGYNSFLRPRKYRPKHPSWFYGEANVFNLTNEKAVRAYIRNVVAYLEERPEVDLFAAWPPDAARWPLPVLKRFGSVSNAERYLVGRLARALATAVPDVLVERIAYSRGRRPPDREFGNHEADILDLAPHRRSYRVPIWDEGDPKNAGFNGLIEAWRDSFSGDVGVYEYYRKYRWHSLPVVLPQLIGNEIPYYRSLGVTGLSTFSEPADWITYELTHLLVAAMSWDAGLDPRAFVEDYLTWRYRGASLEMSEYLRLVERAGRAVFNGPTGDYEDQEVLEAVRGDYLRARRVLAAANGKLPAGEPAEFLVRRLAWNLDFAIADTEISYYRSSAQPAEMAEAQKRTRALVGAHRLDGIILQNHYAMQRYGVAADYGSLGWVFRMYREAW